MLSLARSLLIFDVKADTCPNFGYDSNISTQKKWIECEARITQLVVWSNLETCLESEKERGEKSGEVAVDEEGLGEEMSLEVTTCRVWSSSQLELLSGTSFIVRLTPAHSTSYLFCNSSYCAYRYNLSVDRHWALATIDVRIDVKRSRSWRRIQRWVQCQKSWRTSVTTDRWRCHFPPFIIVQHSEKDFNFKNTLSYLVFAENRNYYRGFKERLKEGELKTIESRLYNGFLLIPNWTIMIPWTLRKQRSEEVVLRMNGNRRSVKRPEMVCATRPIDLSTPLGKKSWSTWMNHSRPPNGIPTIVLKA